MINSKFDLYKSEWLDLVFAKRNKEYGAYYLRQHNAEHTNKAMAITFFSVTAISLIVGFMIRVKPAEIVKFTDVPINNVVVPPPAENKKEIQKPTTAPAKAPIATKAFLPPVVTDKPVTVEPPRQDQLNGHIGQDDVVATGVGDIPIDEAPAKAGNGGGGNAPADDGSTVYDNAGLQVEPQPIGGAAAWAKFLQKNLRYPPQAVEQGVSGKVYVSFIVERDGSLSTFEIVRGVGYGMDEESMRVLKKAPAWRPGIQNGHAVRVKYTLPLNFLLNQE